jgi:hypothetical protein
MGAIDAAQTKLRAMIDNTGKEVMPDAAQSPPAGHDIGPGDQAVAGAAPRRASGPIDSDAGFATSGAEARWIEDVDAGVYDVQPDAAAIREAALVKALDAAFPIVRKASVAATMDAVNASPSDPTALRREAWMRECYAALELVVSARALIDNTGKDTIATLYGALAQRQQPLGAEFQSAIFSDVDSLYDNSPGKEVMPDEARTTRAAHDIGPGDQAVAGAAQCCMCGKRGLSTADDGGPQCELSDGRWVCSSDCYDVALEIMLKPLEIMLKPVAGAALDCECGMGFGPCKDPECKAPILSAGGGAGHRSDCAVHNAPAYPAGHCDCGFVATEGGAPPAWPEGLIHLTNTRRFHVDCATEGCGRRVSTRFDGSDYCEPCGRKVATEGGA